VEARQLERFKRFFRSYVAGFYGDDDYVNRHIRMKDEHTFRVCQEISYLADQLALPAEQKILAETIALFHDIGRFRQFVTYRTYNDVRSTDHCRLGLEVLRETGVLNGLDRQQRTIIERAVEYHGRKELPRQLNDLELLFCRLIRDADKLDVYYVTTGFYKQYIADPSQFQYELELPDEPSYSQHVVQATLQEQLIDAATLRTLNDLKLMQLGWVYDVNFPATLRRIRERRFLEQILSFLPADEQIHKVQQKIFSYIEARIQTEQPGPHQPGR